MIPNRLSRCVLIALALLAAACSDQPHPIGPGDPSAGRIGAATPVAPAMQGVYDDFAGGRVDTTKWVGVGPESWVRQSDRLLVTLAPSVAEHAGLRSRAPQSLTGNAFSIEISQSASAAGNASTESFFSLLSLDGQEILVISSIGGNLAAWYKQRGQPVRQLGSVVAFDPVQHRFRRFREQGGMLYVETSATGESWTQPSGWSLPSFFTTPEALNLQFGARARNTSNTDPVTAIFENVNTLVPAIPSDLTASSDSPTQIMLSWQDRSVNESGFRIERRLPGGSFVEVAIVAADVTSYQDEGLEPATTYEYRVRATNGSGESGYTVPASAITRPPPGPQNPVIGSLREDFAGAEIERSRWNFYRETYRTRQDNRLIITLPRDRAGYGGVISAAPHRFVNTALVVEVSQVAAGGPFTETFIAVSSADEQEYVVIASLNGRIGAYFKWRGDRWYRFRLGAELPFDPVQHRFRRIRVQGGRVHFELSRDGESWMQPPGWNVQHEFTDANNLYAAVGAGAYVQDPNAGIAIFENVNTLVPAIPSDLEASAASASQIDLSWRDRSVNESGFRIERRVEGGTFTEVAALGAGVTSYQDDGLEPGTAYEYRVRAFNGSGESGFSNTAAATTEVPRPAPPPGSAPISRQ